MIPPISVYFETYLVMGNLLRFVKAVQKILPLLIFCFKKKNFFLWPYITKTSFSKGANWFKVCAYVK